MRSCRINRTTSMISSTTCGTHSIVTCVLPSERKHRRSPFLCTPVNSFPDVLTSSVSHHSRARTFLIPSANVKISLPALTPLCLLMRMALPPSDRHRITTYCEVVNLHAQCLARGTELRFQIRSIFLLCLYRKSKITHLRLTPVR